MKYLFTFLVLIVFGCHEPEKGFEGKISSYENIVLDSGDTIVLETIYQDDAEEDTSSLLIHYEEPVEMKMNVGTFYNRMNRILSNSACPKERIFFQGIVDEGGRFVEAEAIKPEIDDACLNTFVKAMKKVDFVPGKMSGRPVRVRMLFSFDVSE